MTDKEIAEKAEEILNRYIAQESEDPSEDRLAEIEILIAVTVISVHKGEDFQTILRGVVGAAYLMGREDGWEDCDNSHPWNED